MFHFNTKPVKNADIADKETKRRHTAGSYSINNIRIAVVAVAVAAVLIVKKSNASKVSS